MTSQCSSEEGQGFHLSSEDLVAGIPELPSGTFCLPCSSYQLPSPPSSALNVSRKPCLGTLVSSILVSPLYVKYNVHAFNSLAQPICPCVFAQMQICPSQQCLCLKSQTAAWWLHLSPPLKPQGPWGPALRNTIVCNPRLWFSFLCKSKWRQGICFPNFFLQETWVAAGI